MANYGVAANPAIRPPGPIQPADGERIIECFNRGLGIAETARELGLSSGQVGNYKKTRGLTPVAKHDNTAGAEAFATKARRNRHARYDDYSTINELSRGKLLAVLRGEKKHLTVLRGMGGTESMQQVEDIPSRDLRETLTALVQLETSIIRIEDKEEDGGQARAISMFEKFTEAAAMLAGTLGTPRPGLIQE